jgi:hypothetical protein
LSGATKDSGALSVTIDTTAPTLSSAVVSSSGTSLTLTYNEALSATTAATSTFSVTRSSGGAISVTAASASGSAITLTVSTIYVGQSVTISYSDPTGSDDANAIQDSAGNDAASLTSQAVTNNSTVKQNQSLSFATTSYSKSYGDTQSVLATGTGSGAITYSAGSSTACTVNSTTGLVTITASSGSCTISASIATDTNYNSANSSNSVTITVSTATPSATLSLASTNFTFRAATTLSAIASVAGKVQFQANGRVIPGCRSRPANNGNSLTATCSYKPATRKEITITAILTPTDSSNYAQRTISSATYQVARRSGGRG